MRFLTPLVLAVTLAVAHTLPAQVVGGRGGRLAVTELRTSGDRPVLGIQTSSGGARDTLGLLVASVTAGGPADGAGIEEGNRLVAINGVNLRLASADAGDPEMTGVLGRRLQRELDKATAGDVVELRVWSDGQTRTVRVKTVRADELQQPARTLVRSRLDDRPTIGASIGGSPSARDTLGVFVVAVADDGPLAKAGVFEGARIAAINGVDLRVPAADAGDDFMSSSRVRRFQREVDKLTAGASVELRVLANGQARTVTVQTVKRSDLKDAHSFTILRPGGGTSIVLPSFDLDGFRFDLQHELPMTIRRSMQDATDEVHRAIERIRDARIHQSLNDRDADRIREIIEERTRDVRRPPPETRERIDREIETVLQAQQALTSTVGAMSQMSAVNVTPAVLTRTVEPTPSESRVFTVSGVRLGPVDEQLASYLGAGSDRGYLVLEVESHWSGIRAGDVLLSIDGRPVRDGGLTRFAPATAREYRVELLRNGKRVTEVVRQH
jgi:C-terminal processing protease CtpA/Prc